ncbi:hypothetical protein NL529_30375, partial [Klebsiella pneumoniae]|nr:hypothetical protein [Klebsiella pneumoniae]
VFVVITDLVAISGLHGYVFRRPIKVLALRLLYLAIALILLLRACISAYFMVPNLFPWRGYQEQYVALFGLLAIPIIILTAYAVWRH